MLFYKFIRTKPKNNKAIIFTLNIVIKLIRFFLPTSLQYSESIVIISIHRLGDSIFTFPAIKKVLEFHKKKIYLISHPETIPIFKLQFSNKLNFISVNHRDFVFNNKFAPSSVRKKLKHLKPEYIYDLTGNVSSASIIIFARAKFIIGVNEEYYKSIYTHFVNIRKTPHITDNYLDAVKAFVPITSTEMLSVSPLESNVSDDYILIHPFASQQAKEWGLRRFIQLAEYLNEKKIKCTIISPVDRIPYELKNYILSKNIQITETKTIEELIKVTSKCIMFIGNDSGPIHIANLLGKPTFTIYGPTNPLFHKPLTGSNDYIFCKLPCSPNRNMKWCNTHAGVFCPSNECMNRLDLSSVQKKLSKFLQKLNLFEEKIIQNLIDH